MASFWASFEWFVDRRGRIFHGGATPPRYTPHQGERERARRLRARTGELLPAGTSRAVAVQGALPPVTWDD